MGKELEKVAGIPMEKIQEMERITKEYRLANLDGEQVIEPALKMAEGMVLLRRMLTEDVMASVNVLQGTRLGFRTDKQGGAKYPMDTVKDCFIEALMMGLRPIGNEFNIISSNTYATKEGFQRLVRELPGLKDLDLRTNLAAKDCKEGTTIDVGFTATWALNGVPDSLEGTIPVRVNRAMGADAILGKAWRKALARIHQKITGSDHELPEGDVTDCDIPGRPVAAEGASVLTPGRHTTRAKKTTGPAEDAEVVPNSAPRAAPGSAPAPGPRADAAPAEGAAPDSAPAPGGKPFEMTGVLAYNLEQAALARGWSMDDLGSYVEEKTGGKMRAIPSQAAYDEIMAYVKAPVAEGDVKG